MSQEEKEIGDRIIQLLDLDRLSTVAWVRGILNEETLTVDQITTIALKLRDRGYITIDFPTGRPREQSYKLSAPFGVNVRSAGGISNYEAEQERPFRLIQDLQRQIDELRGRIDE